MEKKEVSNTTKLKNKLKKLIKDLPEESLVFLIEQAEICKHNIDVDKINKDVILKSQLKKTVDLPIKINADPDKKSFVLEINGQRKFITREEMKTMVKISWASTKEMEVSQRLFSWLYNERKDVLIDGGIRSKQDKKLLEIVKIIKSKYKIKP